MQLRENYEPAAHDLALYCQSLSVIAPLPDVAGYMWLPPSVRKFGATHAEMTADAARVQMGGGFYHWGYFLDKDKDASTAESNAWRLCIRSDSIEEKVLLKFNIPAQQHISAEQFVANAVANYDREIAQGQCRPAWHQRKVQFFLSRNTVSEARNACRSMLRDLPDDWWANLTVALIDARQDAQHAQSQLRSWAEAAPSCSRYLCLAYYYECQDRPVDAAAAGERAADLPVRDKAEGMDTTLWRARGMVIYLYNEKQYTPSIRLCDAIIAYQKDRAARNELNILRNAVVSAQAGKPSQLPFRWRPEDFEPYKMDYADAVDIKKLCGGDNTGGK
jgi:hypothetical protein